MMFDPIPGVSLHARERAVQRLGADPPREEWEAAVLAIIDRKALLVATQVARANPAEVYLVQLLGQAVQVLWRPDGALIVTLLKACDGAISAPQRGDYAAPVRHPRGRAARPLPQPYHRARVMREEWP